MMDLVHSHSYLKLWELQKKKEWKQSVGMQVSDRVGKRVGILGYGSIGRQGKLIILLYFEVIIVEFSVILAGSRILAANSVNNRMQCCSLKAGMSILDEQQHGLQRQSKLYPESIAQIVLHTPRSHPLPTPLW